jgi:hypothetical protein
MTMLPVGIYTYLNGQSVGGRGNQVLQSANVTTNSGSEYSDIDDIIKSTKYFNECVNIASLIGIGHGTTRFTTAIQRYSKGNKLVDGIPAAYNEIFCIVQDENKNYDFDRIEANQKTYRNLIIGIALEKARITAYFDDYRSILQRGVGDGFSMLIGRWGAYGSMGKGEGVLPYYFDIGDAGVDILIDATKVTTVAAKEVESRFRKGKTSLLGPTPKTNVEKITDNLGGTTAVNYLQKAGGGQLGWKDQRRDWMVGCFAFFSILKRHMGTWNLSSLPAIGMYNDIDARIHNALIDAVTTHWWFTSRAHTASNNLDVSEIAYRDNLIHQGFLKAPYLSEHYSPERVYYQIGRRLYLDRKVMQDKFFNDTESKGLGAQSKELSNTIFSDKRDGENILSNKNDDVCLVMLLSPELFQVIDSHVRNFYEDTNLYVQIGRLLVTPFKSKPDSSAPKSPKIKYKWEKSSDISPALYPFNSFITRSGTFAYNDRMLYDMMPTELAGTGKNLHKHIAKVLNVLYDPLRNVAPEVSMPALKKGWNDAKEEFARAEKFDYKARSAEAYQKITKPPLQSQSSLEGIDSEFKGYETPEQIKDKYRKLIIGEKPIISPVGPATSNLSSAGSTPSTAAKDINSKLIDELANLHMGAYASLDPNASGFNQADFNRGVTKALKLIIQKLGEIDR